MQRCFALIGVLCVLLTQLAGAPAAAQQPAATAKRLFLPLVSGPPASPNPFGFDLRAHISDSVVGYVADANPKWTRAGDVTWADIEPVRGGGYHWEVLAPIEANVRRLRARGVEPTLTIHRSPAWAQRAPGHLCSPPKPEYVADFVKFTSAVAARYASGDTAVKYWEIWNEPDFAPSAETDPGGFGCWLDKSLPFYGGVYYGNVLNRVYPAIKAANPNASVLGGALYYDWPNDDNGRIFLNGILSTGAGSAMDALSFHAYGEWGANDLLVNKALQIRAVLSKYGLADKPLFATEIAATCGFGGTCPADFHQTQANYAARIYAEAAALGLQGALWFTLALNDPGFQSSQLIDDKNGKLAPRPSYYAFLNSARLLQGARYIGAPLKALSADQMEQVQALTFRKQSVPYAGFQNAPVTLYVLWVPKIDQPSGAYPLYVKPGSKAVCTQNLEDQVLYQFQCSDTDNDGVIWLAINSLPQYIEVLDQ